MNEMLLQYIWQFQLFNKSSLGTTDAEPLTILHPGTLNTHQGPDFLNARLKIGSTTWVGSIELHVLSSAWQEHGHAADPNYANVILHVVWQQDKELNLPFATLELNGLVAGVLLARYRELMQNPGFIACQSHIAGIPALNWQAWKERLVAERLEMKAAVITTLLQQNNFHWEETCWWIIARQFGATVNAAFFEAVARSLPLALLARHKENRLQLEALLFGQAGMLEDGFNEAYPLMLQKEYRFLQKKYKLATVHGTPYFLRMRPSNFPSVRMAQLAALLAQRPQLFSLVKDTSELAALQQQLRVTANDYWHYHYLFDEPGAYRPKQVGEQMTGQLIVNAVIPLLFCYGAYQDKQEFKEKAINWLCALPPEKNSVTRGFEALGTGNRSAFDSQALWMLKNKYCAELKCLQCAVGNKILRP